MEGSSRRIRRRRRRRGGGVFVVTLGGGGSRCLSLQMVLKWEGRERKVGDIKKIKTKIFLLGEIRGSLGGKCRKEC